MKSLKFLLGFILIVIFFFYLNSYLINNTNLLRFAEKKHILVLGDSHLECALNDNILDTYVNVSKSAEPYFYSYLKLIQFHRLNPQIDTVLIGFSYHNLEEKIDSLWLYNDSHIGNTVEKYIYMMNFDEFSVLYNKRKLSVTSSLLNIPKYTFNSLINYLSTKAFDYRITEFGGYLALNKNLTQSSIITQIQFQLHMRP